MLATLQKSFKHIHQLKNACHTSKEFQAHSSAKECSPHFKRVSSTFIS